MSSNNEDSRVLSATSYYYAGLEVVPDNVPKIVIPSQAELQVRHESPGLEKHSPLAPEKVNIKANETRTKTVWWRRKRFLISVALLVFVFIVGAAGGAALGTRRREDSNASASESPTPTASISSLSVTSLSMGEYTSMLLAYIDPGGSVKYHVRSGDDYQAKYPWSAPQVLGNENKISKSSGIAVSTLLNWVDVHPEVCLLVYCAYYPFYVLSS